MGSSKIKEVIMNGPLFVSTIFTKSEVSPSCIEVLGTNGNTLHLRLIPWGKEWHKTISEKDVRENGLIAIGKKYGTGKEHLVDEKDLITFFQTNTNMIPDTVA